MRYEAFHKQLKNTAKIVTSRVNLLLTLCIKQQLKFSYRILSKKGLCNTTEYKQFLGEIYDIKETILRDKISLMKTCMNTVSEKASVFGSVKINNIKYNIKNIIQINNTVSDCFLKFKLLRYR